MELGLIGLGRMGANMAERLLLQRDPPPGCPASGEGLAFRGCGDKRRHLGADRRLRSCYRLKLPAERLRMIRVGEVSWNWPGG